MPTDKSAYWKTLLYVSSKTYVVGTQKNGLDETVLFSTQKHTFKLTDNKIAIFAIFFFFALLALCIYNEPGMVHLIYQGVTCLTSTFHRLGLLFFAVLWSPAGKGLPFPMWYPRSGVVLHCINS